MAAPAKAEYGRSSIQSEEASDDPPLHPRRRSGEGNMKLVYENDAVRFQMNRLVRDLLEVAPWDLNKIWVLYREGHYTEREMQEFYQQLGYSVDGYLEVWGPQLEPQDGNRAAPLQRGDHRPRCSRVHPLRPRLLRGVLSRVGRT